MNRFGFDPRTAHSLLKIAVAVHANLVVAPLSRRRKVCRTCSCSTFSFFRCLPSQRVRYYFEKFGITPLHTEVHERLRAAYVEGLLWCLAYYYRGCVSWGWFFPFHYVPMISDLVREDDVTKAGHAAIGSVAVVVLVVAFDSTSASTTAAVAAATGGRELKSLLRTSFPRVYRAKNAKFREMPVLRCWCGRHCIRWCLLGTAPQQQDAHEKEPTRILPVG